MNEKTNTEQFIAIMCAKLQMCFYDTPEFIFEAIGKIAIHDNMSRTDFDAMCWTAIRTVKKTRISVADILSCYEKSSNEPKLEFYETSN